MTLGERLGELSHDVGERTGDDEADSGGSERVLVVGEPPFVEAELRRQVEHEEREEPSGERDDGRRLRRLFAEGSDEIRTTVGGDDAADPDPAD